MSKQKIIFDTDCLSSFLWTNEINILKKLFPKQIFITDSLYDEVSVLGRGKFKYVYERLVSEVKSGEIQILSIEVGSELADLREEISTEYLSKFQKIIGAGELDMLVFAKHYNCTCLINTASNNLRDILWYLKKENIKNISTMDILCYSHEKLGLKFEELNILKNEMVNRKRKLPQEDIETYYKKNYNKPFSEEIKVSKKIFDTIIL